MRRPEEDSKRKSRFGEEPIVGIPKEHGAGGSTAALCRRHGIGAQAFSRRKQKFGGLEVSDAQRLKALEEENARRKRLVAEQAPDNRARKELLRTNR